jgi:hypothetical protein
MGRFLVSDYRKFIERRRYKLIWPCDENQLSGPERPQRVRQGVLAIAGSIWTGWPNPGGSGVIKNPEET